MHAFLTQDKVVRREGACGSKPQNNGKIAACAEGEQPAAARKDSIGATNVAGMRQTTGAGPLVVRPVPCDDDNTETGGGRSIR